MFLSCCCIEVLPVGSVLRTGASLQGRSSDCCAVDGTLSNEQTGIRQLKPTAASLQASDETAGRPHKPTSGMLSRQSARSVEATNLMSDLGHSVIPGVLTDGSVDQPSQQSSIQCPVKLNGISYPDKSADTCSGM